MTYPNPYSKTQTLTAGVAALMLLVVLIIGPWLLGWIEVRPWTMPLAIVTLIAGGLGFVAFALTLRQVERQEAARRREAADRWLEMIPAEFEAHVAGLFETQGYQAKIIEGARQGGVDLLVKKGEQRGVVQCKLWLDQKVGVGVVQEFVGVVNRSNATQGFLVTPYAFTYPAQERARQSRVSLIDGDVLAAWLRAARQEPYSQPLAYPLRFSPGQWLVLLLLGPALVGVLGLLIGLVVGG